MSHQSQIHRCGFSIMLRLVCFLVRISAVSVFWGQDQLGNLEQAALSHTQYPIATTLLSNIGLVKYKKKYQGLQKVGGSI